MKRLLGLLLVILLASSAAVPAIATEVGFIVDKEVNGNWQESFVVNFEINQAYPKAYLDTAMVFEAPRVNMLEPDHKYFEAVIGAKFNVLNGELDLNTGIRKDFQGNEATYTSGGSLMWNI